MVEAVASGAEPYDFVTAEFRSITGIEAYRPTRNATPYLRDTHGVGVYIVHDPTARRGFRVVTAYPRDD
jgi:hypothetical protein